MATLTYDSTNPNEPEFSPEEQDSLARGEAQLAEEQKLLAGKFQDAEALEQAYIELQQKLGSNEDETDDTSEADAPEETSEEETKESEEEEVDSEEGEVEFSEEEVTQIQNIVGGEQEYDNMLKWAASNLEASDIDAFDHVIGLNDARAAAFAVSVLNNIYKNSVGSEGELLTGGKPQQVADVFESQAQVVEAMSDPKYDRDPAYRQSIMQKLERSNVQY